MMIRNRQIIVRQGDNIMPKLVTWVICPRCKHEMQKYQVKEGNETTCYSCGSKFSIKKND